MNTIQKTLLFLSFFNTIVINSKESMSLEEKVTILQDNYKKTCYSQTMTKQERLADLSSLKYEAQILLAKECKLIAKTLGIISLSCITLYSAYGIIKNIEAKQYVMLATYKNSTQDPFEINKNNKKNTKDFLDQLNSLANKYIAVYALTGIASAIGAFKLGSNTSDVFYLSTELNTLIENIDAQIHQLEQTTI